MGSLTLVAPTACYVGRVAGELPGTVGAFWDSAQRRYFVGDFSTGALVRKTIGPSAAARGIRDDW